MVIKMENNYGVADGIADKIYPCLYAPNEYLSAVRYAHINM